MKKLVSLILISILLIAVSTTVFAVDPTESLTGDGNSEQTETVTKDEYDEAQKEEEKVEDDKTKLPQTGIEDSGVVALLIICAGSAIFAYRKISDYKNI